MAYVFDTLEDIIKYLQFLTNVNDPAWKKEEFEQYFAAYEKCVRSHNDLSGISDDEIRSKLISNLVYLTGYCDDNVRICIEHLTGKTLLEVHAGF